MLPSSTTELFLKFNGKIIFVVYNIYYRVSEEKKKIYLIWFAGKWDATRQHLRVSHTYPCKYNDDSTQECVESREQAIRAQMETKVDK